VTAAPSFWWRRRPGALALLLWPAARLVGLAAGWRMGRLPRFRPPVPVICIGNYVVGGAGKTPTALALARIARGRGLKPGFLASGYGGSAAGPLRVDPAVHTAALVGDEPLLLAAAAPTVVGRDRAAAARLLVEAGVDLIVMDDGFQNPLLAKDVSLVCVDGAVGIGNGLTLPAGPLRAPLALQLRRTDALLVIGEANGAEPLIRAAARSGRPVLRAMFRPARVRDWRKEPILAYAGIGRPEKFFESLRAIEAPVAKAVAFPDHHAFTEAEARRLLAEAEAGGLRLVTTEKDLVRLAGTAGSLAALRQKSEAFPVTIEFENPAAVAGLLAEAVERAAGR
jgi:tetraacyldisaccharide 4'-kinase